MLDRTAAPPFNNIQEIIIKQPEKKRLANGIDLYTLQSGSQEVIKVELLFHTGKYDETHNGSAFFAGKMLAEGTPDKSSNEISAIFDSYGAHLEIVPGLDHLEISIYCLSKHFQYLAHLLRDIITKPSIPEAELETQKNIRLQSLHVNNEKNGFLATKFFRKNLFGPSHPYGVILEDEHILTTTQEIVKEYVERNILNNPFTIIASGKFDEVVVQTIEDLFGNISVNNTVPIQNRSFTPSHDNLYVEKSESVQTSIRMGCASISIDHPDHLNLLVANEILGGYFGSRLMKNIREEKGLTYGIYSGLAHLSKSSYFIISADIKKENREEAVDEITKEILQLQSILVDANELETVRNYMLGQLQSSINTPFELAAKFKLLHVHDLSYSYYTSLIHTITHITAEEIREVSKKLLDPTSMQVIAVG